uniref:U3 small nucleolar ribonucleoprotein protein IMP3 n=1 Tax=Phallusia mammillata TaxID=59560 RepID=A0A6F9DFN3_9ASCI|nr:U3 small nucleolar ribonucleoprotein protein IMP3-like [Phallusia mammillata]
MRKLRFHEKKLLKKVDFFAWEADNNLHEVKIMRKYRIQKREHYTAYNKMSREVRTICRKIRDLDQNDPFRVRCTSDLIEKLYNLGIIPTRENLELADKVTASSFCRRRLPVIMVKLKMAQSLKSATEFIEQGHIRVGTKVVLDPAFLVTRSLEDFVTWKETSKIKQHILEYNDERDDYDFA